MGTAQNLINEARSYAGGTLGAGQAQLAHVQSLLENLIKANPPPSSPQLPLDVPAIEVPGEAPKYTGSKFSRETFEAAAPHLLVYPKESWGASPTGEPGIPGSLLADRAPPDGDPGVLTATAPTVRTELAIPPDPNLLAEIRGIPKPELTPLKIPEMPTPQEPVFEGVLPTLNVDPPKAGALESAMRSGYADAANTMRASVVSQVEQFMQTKWPGLAGAQAQIDKFLAGGTGFKPEVEDAIFNRTLDKTNNEGKRAAAKAWGEAARAGFTIPSAILLSQQQDIDQERRNLNARTAIDVAIKQAELEQANLQFATQQSVQMVNVIANAAIGYIGALVSLNGHAVEYARSVVDAVVKGYDIAAKYTEIQARIYESEAKVYEVKWQGVQARVDAYKAKIQAVQAEAQVDEARVAAYRARLEAVQSEATVYRSQVEAAVAAAGLERSRVELYQAQVQAYVAQVNAFTAKWQGYEAVARSDAARYQITDSQYRLYLEKWQAYEAEVRATATKVDSTARMNEAMVRQYNVQAEAYATKIRGESEGIRAETAAYEAEIRAYTADADAKASKHRSEVAAWEATVRSLVAQIDILIQQMRSENDRAVAVAHSISQIGSTVGNMYASTAQAALSGINSLATIAATE